MSTLTRSRHVRFRFSTSFTAAALVLVALVLSASPSANALPAFARKYGLRCSACHESWPMLNYFGQKFKDNGYQLMNDRDSPIWQNPGYWPVTFRITPIWHRVSTGKVEVDTYAGGAPTGNSAIQRVTSSGFDLSGLDFHTGGTLEKNFSFYVLPSSDATASFHFETVMARLDNLFGSPWLNIKLGKFELDNLLSEKRILTLTGNGGIYQLYHFIPVGDGNIFGQMGDNQLGLEVMGHSNDDRTRYSVALLSSVDGNVGLPYGNAYTGFFTFSQAFDAGRLGVDRIGGYAMIGQAPTYYLTQGGTPLAGAGLSNQSFSREGFFGQFYFGQHFDLQVVTQHGSDNAWFGQGYGDLIGGTVPGNNVPGTTLPTGAQTPSWNGVLFEPHYVYSPQLIFIGRFETIRMSQQANGAACTTSPGVGQCFNSTTGAFTAGASASNFGNITTYTIGYRYNPFMTSRAGFAWHNEYNWLHQDGTGPTLGLGTANINTSELLLGFDFDF
ncbi:MAG TPA: hypothetical protein VKF84_06055 [Candidatus Sulfotelmatobacter sp.]|nr:hypothetical protein [Candidatus Sulfotelmatobacter sp.]